MSEEDLELLITTDDPGEDTLGDDTFHNHSTEKTGRVITQGCEATNKRLLPLIVSLLESGVHSIELSSSLTI